MLFSGFERRHEKLAPLSVFVWRLVKSIGVGSAMIGAALLIGVAGYHWFAKFDWIDSILEASMILGGMGPVNGDKLFTNTAKLFASAYALFSGLIFIGVMGVVLSPIMHRLMHKFHLDKEGRNKSSEA
jgi:hypothetical protein